MATSDASGISEIVGRLLVPLCAASGALVLAGFFFPTLVGEAVTGPAWLTIALVFFSSGLCYIALLPYSEDATAPAAADVLLRVRRTKLRRAIKEFLTQHEPAILAFPVLVFAAFFGLQIAFPARTTGAVDAAAATVLRGGGPLFLAAVFLSVCYCLFLLLGPWGEIKLGGPDTEPSYTYPTYFTLVFTAGIAAGLVFWGPTEALFHYDQPPPYIGAAAGSPGAINGALVYTLFHWGVSAWSAYAVIGVPIAYFAFTRGAPLRVSTVLAPLLGVDELDSAWATLVDTLAVFATIGGIATSVALVSEQFLAGINYQWDVAAGEVGPVLFVGGLTLIFVVSSATGIHRGIRRIAGLNIVLFGLFALLIAAVGPRLFILQRGTQALGTYVVEFVPLSLHTGGQWVAAWTVWNWSWWFSWAPFAGLFIAALSRGRRVRTVVFTSVVATSAATMVWFLLLGGTSLFIQQTGQADILAAIAQRGGSEAVAGFPLFASLPLGQLLMFLFLALIIVFMATSADTSTLVVSVLATRRGMAPSATHIVFWGIFQGSVAVSVLLLGGAETLQALAVLTGGPFAVISLVAVGGLTVTWYRDEQGHTSLFRRAVRKLPDIQTHHDVDPPEKK
ncbi:BCCT family transporter [Haloarcula marismortui]|uniref:Glycine betaine transporter BetL n=1 Tax=Haloarcula marismortui ATCC 33799 TaxID=662475 RepID=M0JQ10_9EURY|nr:BCCT family transporter [Haloarcula californiae]EMA10463.1 glycine betaine transporter BetL [Haloarcula californiae ATCC 33799]